MEQVYFKFYTHQTLTIKNYIMSKIKGSLANIQFNGHLLLAMRLLVFFCFESFFFDFTSATTTRASDGNGSIFDYTTSAFLYIGFLLKMICQFP